MSEVENQAEVNNGTSVQEGPTSCGASLDEHVKSTIIGMMLVGAGGGCVDTYRALVEIAVYLKNRHGYPEYTTDGELAVKVEKELIAEGDLRREQAQEQYLKTMEVPSGKVN